MTRILTVFYDDATKIIGVTRIGDVTIICGTFRPQLTLMLSHIVIIFTYDKIVICDCILSVIMMQ